MTITFAAYAAPAGWERPVAVAVVVLLVLAVVVAAGVSSGLPAAHLADASSLVGSDAYGILQSGVWVVSNGTGTSAKPESTGRPLKDS